MSEDKKKKMRVLYASFEAVPFVKCGGLADVAGTLPMSISIHNCDIRVILPYHSIISQELKLRIKKIGDYEVMSEGKMHNYELHYIKLRGVVFYLIKSEEFFDRENVYGEKDDINRFVFFCRSILDSIKHMEGFKPQILHCNDWHTSLCNLYLHQDFEQELEGMNIKTVFTIHNLQYQGKFKWEDVKDILGVSYNTAQKMLIHKGKVNLMKCGIMASDCVTTPSPSYAKEILTYEYGVGLESVLKTKKDVTHGILNGIDYVDFNPA